MLVAYAKVLQAAARRGETLILEGDGCGNPDCDGDGRQGAVVGWEAEGKRREWEKGQRAVVRKLRRGERVLVHRPEDAGDAQGSAVSARSTQIAMQRVLRYLAE